jgi:broad specificity phosphatase PhoE
MKLYLVRHGESNGNATGDYSTKSHDNLSENGLSQARDLADRLKDFRFDAIYCSPLQRSIQTITPYAISQDLKIEIWPELAEACWQEDTTILEKDTPIYSAVDALTDLQKTYFTFRENQQRTPCEDETYSHGVHRLEQAIDLIKNLHENSTDHILIVGHGYANCILIELLLGLPHTQTFDHVNTGISLLKENEKGIFKVKFINRFRLDDDNLSAPG